MIAEPVLKESRYIENRSMLRKRVRARTKLKHVVPDCLKKAEDVAARKRCSSLADHVTFPFYSSASVRNFDGVGEMMVFSFAANWISVVGDCDCKEMPLRAHWDDQRVYQQALIHRHSQ